MALTLSARGGKPQGGLPGTGLTLSPELSVQTLIQETVGCAVAEVGVPYFNSTSMVPLWVLAALPSTLQSCLHQEERWEITLSHL